MRSWFAARSAGRIFRATLRSSFVSCAKYTSPMPPTPILETMRECESVELADISSIAITVSVVVELMLSLLSQQQASLLAHLKRNSRIPIWEAQFTDYLEKSRISPQFLILRPRPRDHDEKRISIHQCLLSELDGSVHFIHCCSGDCHH